MNVQRILSSHYPNYIDPAVDAKIRDAYLDHTERTDEQINVSEYNLLRTRIDVKRKSAVLRFRFIWHRSNTGIVRKSVVVEPGEQGSTLAEAEADNSVAVEAEEHRSTWAAADKSVADRKEEEEEEGMST